MAEQYLRQIAALEELATFYTAVLHPAVQRATDTFMSDPQYAVLTPLLFLIHIDAKSCAFPEHLSSHTSSKNIRWKSFLHQNREK